MFAINLYFIRKLLLKFDKLLTELIFIKKLRLFIIKEVNYF